MSRKRYVRKCNQCGIEYVAKSTKSQFCSNACKGVNWHSRRNDYQKTIKAKDKTIEIQAKAIRAILPDPATIEKVSCEVGKDLTECKRPDGSHLYTELDLWILVSKLANIGFTGRVSFASASGPPLLSVLSTNQTSMELISDFERRFQCKFDDVRRSSPYVHAKEDGSEDEVLINRYAELQYSR